MKTIKAYWENKEWVNSKVRSQYGDGFIDKSGMQLVRHFVDFEVPDDATDEEIESIAHRKDVKILK